VSNGKITVVRPAAEAVTLIFTRLREGSSIHSVVDEMVRRFPTVDGKDKPQHWDSVKVRRILKHAALYCRGETMTPDGPVSDPSIAFLPPDWVDTRPGMNKDT
jgi:hypothetical protein